MPKPLAAPWRIAGSPWRPANFPPRLLATKCRFLASNLNYPATNPDFAKFCPYRSLTPFGEGVGGGEYERPPVSLEL